MARKDYLNDPHAPQANSIVVASSSFIQREDGKILFIRRVDNGYYSIPGGRLEPGETLSQCAIRETREETGIRIVIDRLVGVFSNPNHVIAYSDGEVRQEFSVCFHARPVGGKLETSSESSECIWIDPDSIGQLRVHESTLLRLNYALSGNVSPYFS